MEEGNCSGIGNDRVVSYRDSVSRYVRRDGSMFNYRIALLGEALSRNITLKVPSQMQQAVLQLSLQRDQGKVQPSSVSDDEFSTSSTIAGHKNGDDQIEVKVRFGNVSICIHKTMEDASNTSNATVTPETTFDEEDDASSCLLPALVSVHSMNCNSSSDSSSSSGASSNVSNGTAIVSPKSSSPMKSKKYSSALGKKGNSRYKNNVSYGLSVGDAHSCTTKNTTFVKEHWNDTVCSANKKLPSPVKEISLNSILHCDYADGCYEELSLSIPSSKFNISTLLVDIVLVVFLLLIVPVGMIYHLAEQHTQYI